MQSLEAPSRSVGSLVLLAAALEPSSVAFAWNADYRDGVIKAMIEV